jgi:hypothetical protein
MRIRYVTSCVEILLAAVGALALFACVPKDDNSAPDAGIDQNLDDLEVYAEIFRMTDDMCRDDGWYRAGSVNTTGSCQGGTYHVSGTLQSGIMDLTFDLNHCSRGLAKSTLGFQEYTGTMYRTGTNPTGGPLTNLISSDSVTVTGMNTDGSPPEGGPYTNCPMNGRTVLKEGATVGHTTGTICNRAFTSSPYDGTGSDGGGENCSAACPSTCTGNVPEQACFYCQAACLCACANDSACEAANRQSAMSLGTTCP